MYLSHHYTLTIFRQPSTFTANNCVSVAHKLSLWATSCHANLWSGFTHVHTISSWFTTVQ